MATKTHPFRVMVTISLEDFSTAELREELARREGDPVISSPIERLQYAIHHGQLSLSQLQAIEAAIERELA